MIEIKTANDIKIIKEGAVLLKKILKRTAKKVQPGITTNDLNQFAEELILKSGAQPAFKGYENFPKTLCVSLNSTIVHGLPSEYQLKEGDIISLDLGIFFKGFYSDMAITLGVGKVPPLAQRLIKVTKKALRIAISSAKPRKTFGDIGYVVEKYVNSQGFNVIRDLCGHGIGRELHEDPKILNYGEKGTGPKIKEGMVFCIEPMVSLGDWHIKKSSDGFGWETIDGSLSAHFEAMVAVSRNSSIVL